MVIHRIGTRSLKHSIKSISSEYTPFKNFKMLQKKFCQINQTVKSKLQFHYVCTKRTKYKHITAKRLAGKESSSINVHNKNAIMMYGSIWASAEPEKWILCYFRQHCFVNMPLYFVQIKSAVRAFIAGQEEGCMIIFL